MTFDAPNPAPRSPALLEQILTTPERQYMFVDIGARSANHNVYNKLGRMCRIIGFDADAEECERLNTLNPSGLARFYPYIIAGAEEERTFYVTRYNHCSSLLRARPQWFSRFPWRIQDVMREFQVMTSRLDTFAARENIGHMDFIKIDVEGAELEVMRGATRSLVERGVLCIQTEVWWDPVLKGQPPFAELDIFIRQQGFSLFDLSMQRRSRTTLPVGRLAGTADRVKGTIRLRYDESPYGQTTDGDALYFRDPVGERREGTRTLEWTDDRLLRLCGLLDVFDYGDSAIEILEEFRPQLSQHYDVDALIAAMVPSVEGQVFGYREYLDISNDLCRQLNKNQLDDDSWEPPPSRFGV